MTVWTMRRSGGRPPRVCLVRLLGEKSVDEIVAPLSPAELEQVINIVGRSPSAYPPRVYAALKDKTDLAPSPQADSAPRKAAPRKPSPNTHRCHGS
jgi:hypothetical protein